MLEERCISVPQCKLAWGKNIEEKSQKQLTKETHSALRCESHVLCLATHSLLEKILFLSNHDYLMNKQLNFLTIDGVTEQMNVTELWPLQLSKKRLLRL